MVVNKQEFNPNERMVQIEWKRKLKLHWFVHHHDQRDTSRSADCLVRRIELIGVHCAFGLTSSKKGCALTHWLCSITC